MMELNRLIIGLEIINNGVKKPNTLLKDKVFVQLHSKDIYWLIIQWT